MMVTNNLASRHNISKYIKTHISERIKFRNAI